MVTQKSLNLAQIKLKVFYQQDITKEEILNIFSDADSLTSSHFIYLLNEIKMGLNTQDFNFEDNWSYLYQLILNINSLFGLNFSQNEIELCILECYLWNRSHIDLNYPELVEKIKKIINIKIEDPLAWTLQEHMKYCWLSNLFKDIITNQEEIKQLYKELKSNEEKFSQLYNNYIIGGHIN